MNQTKPLEASVMTIAEERLDRLYALANRSEQITSKVFDKLQPYTPSPSTAESTDSAFDEADKNFGQYFDKMDITIDRIYKAFGLIDRLLSESSL